MVTFTRVRTARQTFALSASGIGQTAVAPLAMNATNLPTVRPKPPAAPPTPAIPETPSEPIVMRAYVGETGSSPTPAANALQAESGREPVGGRGVRVGLGLRLFLGFFVVVFLGAGILVGGASTATCRRARTPR